MNSKTIVGIRPLISAIVALSLLAGSASDRPARSSDQDFDAAMGAYERTHWDAAHAAFTALADRGHPNAARITV